MKNNKSKKYIVFSPYFGKLPSNFNLWLNSCSYNKEFDFVVFTDNEVPFAIPDNVKIINISFMQFKNQLQKKFDFTISLDNPYKLCDFKPVYGFIFSDIINNYDYWGHCDMDLIFGNISKFIPKDKYDKISYLGHFCLYKNNKMINEMFKKSPKNTLNYVDILSNSQHFGFDEIGDYSINNIFKNNNLKIYNFSKHVADVDCRKTNMHIIRFDNGVFKIDKTIYAFVFYNGIIKSINIKTNSKSEEFAYAHFQKRKMFNNVENLKKFIIKYDGFIDYNTKEELKSHQLIDCKWIIFKYNAIIRRSKRFINIRKIMKQRG